MNASTIFKTQGSIGLRNLRRRLLPLAGLLCLLCAGGLAAEPAISGAFSNLVFQDDFAGTPDGEQPPGWGLFSSVLHPQCEVRNGQFRILTQGNTHYPACVSLKDFALEFDLHGERNAPVAILYVDFRVQPDLANGYSGYRIMYRWGQADRFAKKFAGNPAIQPYMKYVKKTARFDLLDLRYRGSREPIMTGHFKEIGSPGSFDPTIARANQDGMQDFEDVSKSAHMRIEVEGNTVRLWHEGRFQGEIVDATNLFDRAGFIGFDMEGSYPNFPGSVYVDNVKIFAKEPMREEVITDLKNIEINWKFNRVHGTPMLYDAQAARYGSGYVLRGSVRGGACNPSLPHVMLNPYVKLDTVDGRHSTKLYLFRGTVGHVNIDGQIPAPPFGPADTSGPQQAQCYFDYDPGKHRISVGYEYYVICPGASLAGPCEVVVDASSKKVVNEGLPLKNGVVLTMSSPPEKKVLERVNPTNSFYAGFKEFLADNHFFIEGEKVAFRADLLQVRPDPSLSYLVEFRVKDAFKDRVLKELSRDLAPDRSEAGAQRAAAGLNPLWSDWVDLGKMDPGVYHLELTARDSDGAVKDRIIKAFSVLSAKVDSERTPAERSGLPTIFGDNAYPMQPAYQAEQYHYASIAYIGADLWDAAELQRALNKRIFLAYADISTPAEVEKLKKHIPYAVGFLNPKLPDEYAQDLNATRISYGPTFNPFIKGFVESSRYKAVAGHSLEEALTAKPDYEKLKNEVKRHYWKDFIGYVVQRNSAAARSARAYIQKITPNFLYFGYGYPFPCNIDYMTPYGGITAGAIDLKNQIWERDLVLLEAYYDECRYAPERDWACWALMKMVQPSVKYMEDDEGYVSCMEDGNNAQGWPPFGVMKVAPGFFTKEVAMTVFCPMYFQGKQCRWAWDNYWRVLYFQQPQLDELLEGFKLANRIVPDRPVQTVAYVYAQEWIAQHPEVLDPMMYPYNPADESIVFAYEEGCRAGVLNGFFADVSDLEHLGPSLVNTLVLPPLKYADDKAKKAIRKLHAQGVNLAAFEDVTGLEDLFGVKRLDHNGSAGRLALPKSSEEKKVGRAVPGEPKSGTNMTQTGGAVAECTTVRVADNALAKALLYDVAETNVLHSGNLKTVAYGLAGGQAILECADATGKIAGPALVLNRGPKAATLLWTLEPTDIARSRNNGDRMHGECTSELVRFAMGRGLKAVADTPVTTTEGNLLSFWGKDGKLYVMVYENAFPYPSRTLHPLVKIRMKGIGKYRIESRKDYTPGINTKDEVTFAFDLVAEELAVFALDK